MSAIFVTATGTEIGKTFTCCGLIAELRRRGRTVGALKPLVSGFEMAEATKSDPGLLLAALGCSVDETNLDRIAPWRYRALLAPDMAAQAEGKRVDFDAMLAFCRTAMATKDDLIIEGVGGVMSPISDSETVLDWIIALKLPVLLVSGSYLGSQSHALTALETLRGRGIVVKALALSESADSTVSLEPTAASLARFTQGVPIATLPRGDATSGFARLADLLLEPRQ